MRRGERKRWKQRQRHDVEAFGGDEEGARTRERREERGGGGGGGGSGSRGERRIG